MQPWGLPGTPTKWVAAAILLLMPAVTNSFLALPSDPLNHWLGMLNPYSSSSSETTDLQETSTTAPLISKTELSTSFSSVQPFPTSQPSRALTTESSGFFRFFQYYTPDVYSGTKSIFTEYVNSLTGAYTLIVKDYVADYYTNAIKSYTRATLKVRLKKCIIYSLKPDVRMGFIRRVSHSQRTCP